MDLILEKDRALPLKLTLYDYHKISSSICEQLKGRLRNIDRRMIEGVIYAELHKQFEEFREDTMRMIKEEFKILNKNKEAQK